MPGRRDMADNDPFTVYGGNIRAGQRTKMRRDKLRYSQGGKRLALPCVYFIPLCDNIKPQSMQVLLTFAKGGQADEIQV